MTVEDIREDIKRPWFLTLQMGLLGVLIFLCAAGVLSTLVLVVRLRGQSVLPFLIYVYLFARIVFILLALYQIKLIHRRDGAGRTIGFLLLSIVGLLTIFILFFASPDPSIEQYKIPYSNPALGNFSENIFGALFVALIFRWAWASAFSDKAIDWFNA